MESDYNTSLVVKKNNTALKNAASKYGYKEYGDLHQGNSFIHNGKYLKLNTFDVYVSSYDMELDTPTKEDEFYVFNKSTHRSAMITSKLFQTDIKTFETIIFNLTKKNVNN